MLEMVYFLLRFGLARRPFHLFSKRRRGIPAAPRLKEIRFLKDSLVKASFISIVSALCAPQNRAGCILSVCRLLCRVLVSLHPCLLLPFINPLDGWLSLFVKRLGVNKSRGGSGFSHPHEMSQKGPSEVCCSFEMVPVAVAVLKQRREADAALFSELHRKLQTQVGVFASRGEDAGPVAQRPSYVFFLPFLVPQSVLKHRWSVLYLLLSLAEDPRKPSSRVKNSLQFIIIYLFLFSFFPPCHVWP